MNCRLLTIALKLPLKIKPIKKIILSPVLTSMAIYFSIAITFFAIFKILMVKSK